MSRLRSPTTGRSLGLALPALGALAAEPLYLLADTAIVGHLGTTSSPRSPSPGVSLVGGIPLQHRSPSTTAARCRASPAPPSTSRPGAWRRSRCGSRPGSACVLTALLVGLAVPLVDLMGGEGAPATWRSRLPAHRHARPAVRIDRAVGQGFLRGISDLRTPLVIVVVANVANEKVLNCCSSTASAGASPARRGRPSRRRRAWARRSSTVMLRDRAESRAPRSTRCARWPASA